MSKNQTTCNRCALCLLMVMMMILPCLNAGVSLIVDTYDANDTFLDNEAQRVDFAQAFDEAPLVFALATNQGGDSALIRVFDVDQSGFSSLIVEPESFDGRHLAMTSVTYIAIREGEVTLPDGTVIYAGSESTRRGQGSSSFSNRSWEAVSFAESFEEDTTPTLLTGLQTLNNAPTLSPGEEYDAFDARMPFLSVATDNVTENGFDVALERLETGSGDIEEFNSNLLAEETIGWLAVEQTQGSFNNNGTDILYDFSVFGSAVDGWDNGGEDVLFNQNFTNDNVLVGAQTNTRNGNNGGFIRRGDIDENGIHLYIDEDTFMDSERSHIDETVSIAAFSSAFVYIPEPSSFILFSASLIGLFLMRKPVRKY